MMRAVVRPLSYVWVALAASACGVRTPPPLHGTRPDLVARVLAHPRDVQARLALAEEAERLGRPSEAIAQLDEVVNLGGPLGIRWHASDRARLARLLVARGKARLARGAASAKSDFARAKSFGAVIPDGDWRAAREASAIALMRQVDPELRAQGKKELAALAATASGAHATDDDALRDQPDPAVWRGAAATATPAERGAFGARLWALGARRAAYEELAAWRTRAKAPRPDSWEREYLIALRWWRPVDLPPPAAEDLVGPGRCAFTPCKPATIFGDAELERAFLSAPPVARTRDPDEAAAYALLALHQALRGEAGWGAALAARVDLSAVPIASVPKYVQPLFARLAGKRSIAPSDAELEDAPDDRRLVIAAERALAGEPAPLVEAALGEVRGTPYGVALRSLVAQEPSRLTNPHASAAARYAQSRFFGADLSVPESALSAIAAAFSRDPAIADRLARDAVASAADAAGAAGVIAALFDALGDPARARLSWQAAFDASAEPAFAAGLAEAQARASDPDAALINGTTAAAGCGDPAPAWVRIARALDGAGSHIQALDAARQALDLAGPETLGPALDVTLAASRSLGRSDQVAQLEAERARWVPGAEHLEDDPTDARMALDAFRRAPTGATLARLWVASRWNPRDVSLRSSLLAATLPDDPRHGIAIAELVSLSSDPDPELARAAVAALR